MASLVSCSRKGLEGALQKEGVSIALDQQYDLVSKTDDPYVVIAKSPDGLRLIKVQVIKVQNKEEALKKIKNQLKLKMLSYNISAVPYPGQMTNEAKCDASFQPKLQKGSGFSYLSTLASERLTPVICQGEEVKFQAGTAFFIEKNHTRVLIVEFYIGKQLGIMDINNFFEKHFTNMERVEIDLL